MKILNAENDHILIKVLEDVQSTSGLILSAIDIEAVRASVILGNGIGSTHGCYQTGHIVVLNKPIKGTRVMHNGAEAYLIKAEYVLAIAAADVDTSS